VNTLERVVPRSGVAVVLALVLVSVGCSSLDGVIGGGRVGDAQGLVAGSTVEFVEPSDPRVAQLDFEVESVTFVLSGQANVQVVFEAQHCGALPAVEVSVIGPQLRVQVDQDKAGRACANGEIAFVDLQLVRNFDRVEVEVD